MKQEWKLLLGFSTPVCAEPTLLNSSGFMKTTNLKSQQERVEEMYRENAVMMGMIKILFSVSCIIFLKWSLLLWLPSIKYIWNEVCYCDCLA